MTPKMGPLVPLFLLAFGQAPVCLAQEVTVVLLDVRTGHPVANETVSMQFHIATVDDLQAVEVKTGADGNAKFHLPEPIPSEVTVRPVNLKLYPCSSLLLIDTRQVITEGLVSCCSKRTQGCRCKFGRQVTQLKKTPGELVFLVRPVSWEERLRAHLWE